MYKIDPTTGAATWIGSTGKTGDMTTLDVDRDTGIMYGGDNSNGDLYTIDKNTGAATKVGPTGLGGLQALGSVPAVTAIPALNYAGLAALVLLLAGLSLVALRLGRS